MPNTTKAKALKELQFLCQRYLDACNKDEINSPLYRKIKALKDDPTITDPAEFINKLNQKHWELRDTSILAEIAAKKVEEIEDPFRIPLGMQIFWVVVGTIFLFLIELMAFTDTRGLNPFRVFYGKNELFLADVSPIQKKYEIVPAAAVATTPAVTVTPALAAVMLTPTSTPLPPQKKPRELGGSFFGPLPDDVLGEILKYGKIEETLNLAKTNPMMRARVKGMAADTISNALLTCTTQVSHEDIETIKRILDVFPELLFQKREVTDPCGRKFSSISALQYARWAKDADLLDLMLEHIKDNPKYATEAQTQLNELATTGVEFIYTKLAECPGYPEIKEGACINGSHEFDNTQLQNAYETFTLNSYLLYLQWWSNIAQLSQNWREIVGGAQRLLPASFAQAYCQDFHFGNKLTKELDTLFRKPLIRTTYMEGGSWFPLAADEGLGFNVGIVRAGKTVPLYKLFLKPDFNKDNQPSGWSNQSLTDSKAYDILCQVRAERMKEFDQKLKLKAVAQAEVATPVSASRRPSLGG